jgi:hypothetical protein
VHVQLGHDPPDRHHARSWLALAGLVAEQRRQFRELPGDLVQVGYRLHGQGVDLRTACSL